MCVCVCARARAGLCVCVCVCGERESGNLMSSVSTESRLSLSVCLPISIHLSPCLSVHLLSASLSLSVYLSVSVCLSLCLCLSVSLSLSFSLSLSPLSLPAFYLFRVTFVQHHLLIIIVCVLRLTCWSNLSSTAYPVFVNLSYANESILLMTWSPTHSMFQPSSSDRLFS